MKLYKKNSFSLLEMAIVLVIMSVLTITVVNIGSSAKKRAKLANAINQTANANFINKDSLVFWLESSSLSNTYKNDDVIHNLIDSSKNSIDFISNNENYPKFEERAPDKWNEALKFVFCPQTKPAAKGSKDEIKTEININIPKNGEDLIFMNKESLLVPQVQEDLNSGQVIEIEAWLEPRKVQLGIAYLKEINQWVIVYFNDQSVKGGK